MILKKINAFFFNFTLNDRIGKFEKEMEYLGLIKEPVDTLSRSYAQYKAQKYILGRGKFLLINIFLFFVPLTIFILKLFSFLFPNLKYDSSENIILTEVSKIETIPLELIENKTAKKFERKFLLNRKDIIFLFKLTLKYWFEPYYIFKISLKTALYSYNIFSVKPAEIIVQNEYSFTSSALTAYCRMFGIIHINVMHGEKLLLIRDSFFEYDKCYVWNKHYINIFLKLRAKSDQFIVKMPEAFIKQEQVESINHGQFKYYMNGSETLQDILIIKQKIPLVIFRPHPIYSIISGKYIKELYFEYPSCVSIDQSLMESEFVCARYSTVLFQAWLKGKKVVIDDLTYKELFNDLKLRNYFLLKQNVLLLSDFNTG